MFHGNSINDCFGNNNNDKTNDICEVPANMMMDRHNDRRNDEERTCNVENGMTAGMTDQEQSKRMKRTEKEQSKRTTMMEQEQRGKVRIVMNEF